MANLQFSEEFIEILMTEFSTNQDRAEAMILTIMSEIYAANNGKNESADAIMATPVIESKASIIEDLKRVLYERNPENMEFFRPKIPIFKDSSPEISTVITVEDPSLWVKEFRDMFKEANLDRWGTQSTCIERLKTFLKQYPSVTKEEILQATRAYINNTNRNYIMKSHKFIFDGAGASRNSTLEEWIEKIREHNQKQENLKNSADLTEKIQ